MARSHFMPPQTTLNLEENSIDFRLGGYGKGAWIRVDEEDESSYDENLSASIIFHHNDERLLFLYKVLRLYLVELLIKTLTSIGKYPGIMWAVLDLIVLLETKYCRFRCYIYPTWFIMSIRL